MKPDAPLRTKLFYLALEALVVFLPRIAEHESVFGNRAQILKKTAGKPYCHICNLRIYLSDEWNSPEAFTIDHVVPLSSKHPYAKCPENMRPAHKLCNSLKDCTGVPKPSTLAKLERMKERIRERMELDKVTTGVV